MQGMPQIPLTDLLSLLKEIHIGIAERALQLCNLGMAGSVMSSQLRRL